MQYNQFLSKLKEFVVTPGEPPIFVLPEDAMHTIYEHIVKNKLYTIIELGTGYGTTACAMAAAVQEIGRGKVVTVDRMTHPTKVTSLMKQVSLPEYTIEVVVDNLGYNWYLADLIQKQTNSSGICVPIFDFCFLDGAHEWCHDALAFLLVAKLLKPGGWIAFDDINWKLRMFPNLQESPYSNYSSRELDTFQIKMVYDLVVRQHSDFDSFHLTNGVESVGHAR